MRFQIVTQEEGASKLYGAWVITAGEDTSRGFRSAKEARCKERKLSRFSHQLAGRDEGRDYGVTGNIDDTW